ncbi:WD40-repeat-containing domain protein [Fomitopsis serialis]|uniref:WD40-repeat-containing domain protein n=1 Tax=Fomitopsis serialis TaxID=139415 RepID=UPI0020079DD7|nr:WD40-repeat-containing domain protein [Neoantrodia serialis]KAH9917438.1 WD40-repeat-containing domain protein [Neoantrodia serialis]
MRARGIRIITASDDHTISIHSLPTGELIRTLKGHRGGVWSLAVTRNILVSGSTDRTVRVWDLDTGRCTHTFGGHTSTVRCVAIVRPEFIDVKQDDGTTVQEEWPKHPLIVSASRDHTLRYAEFHSSVDEGGAVEDDTETNPYHKLLLEGHDDAIRGLAARGRTIVSGGYDCIVGVWDAITGTCKWVLAGHTEKARVLGGMDGTVRVWNLETGECQHVLRGHTSLVGLLSLSPSLLRVWDPDTGDHIETLVDSSLRPSAVTCSQHDGFKVLAGSDGALKMWDVQSGMELRDLLQGVVGVWQVAFEGRWCVAASSNVNCTMLDIWDFAREDDAEWIRESPDAAYDEYSDVEEH